MAKVVGETEYLPGMYAKPRQRASEMAHQLIGRWDKERLEYKHEATAAEMPPTICFSRKIGVGALEIADILGERLGYRVIDREIIEQIASKADLNEKTVHLFDESYPGRLKEFLAFVFGEKAFIRTDYTRNLFSILFSMANLSPAIFVGRGAHLVLPRDRVLAVRFISSVRNRAKRLAGLLNVTKKEAESRLEQADREQRDFFKRIYGKKDAEPYEFDLVINCDFMTEPQWAAEIVAKAFQLKFEG